MPKPKVAVIVSGGNVIDVISEVEIDVYLLDYDNPVETPHTDQRLGAIVSKSDLDDAFSDWDDAAKENVARYGKTN